MTNDEKQRPSPEGLMAEKLREGVKVTHKPDGRFEFEPVPDPSWLAGLQVGWVDADTSEDEPLTITCGAGVGSPWIHGTVGGRRYRMHVGKIMEALIDADRVARGLVAEKVEELAEEMAEAEPTPESGEVKP